MCTMQIKHYFQIKIHKNEIYNTNLDGELIKIVNYVYEYPEYLLYCMNIAACSIY